MSRNAPKGKAGKGMLVLTRPVDQGDKSVIMIGDGIEVTVVEVRGDQVRIGIKAPQDVDIDRSEVWEDKRAEGGKRSASESKP